MDLSILIPTHNRAAILAQTLESLCHVEIPDGVRAEVLVVANGCTDDTVQVVASAPHVFPTRCVEEPELGLNPARNRAIREAQTDVLCYLDDDVWVERSWLRGITKLFSRPEVDMGAGPVHPWWSAVQRPVWFDDWGVALLSGKYHGEQPCELHRPSDSIGANMAFRRRVFDRIGPFKLGLDRKGSQLLAGGDTEIMERAFAAGYRQFYHPEAAVKHWVAPHRITRGYLTGVSWGMGYSGVLLKQNLGAKRILRSVAGHIYLACAHAVLAGIARSESSRMRHAVLAATGRGGVRAWADRAMRRSPF